MLSEYGQSDEIWVLLRLSDHFTTTNYSCHRLQADKAVRLFSKRCHVLVAKICLTEYFDFLLHSSRSVVKALSSNLECLGFDPLVLRCEKPPHIGETKGTSLAYTQ